MNGVASLLRMSMLDTLYSMLSMFTIDHRATRIWITPLYDVVLTCKLPCDVSSCSRMNEPFLKYQ